VSLFCGPETVHSFDIKQQSQGTRWVTQARETACAQISAQSGLESAGVELIPVFFVTVLHIFILSFSRLQSSCYWNSFGKANRKSSTMCTAESTPFPTYPTTKKKKKSLKHQEQ